MCIYCISQICQNELTRRKMWKTSTLIDEIEPV